jgi:predicted outer membrane repeat protein
MAEWGGCIHATDKSNLTVLTSVFYQNTAYKGGGSVYASDETKITIINSAFREN